MSGVASEAMMRALRMAAVRATRAPSVHNTQPWRFVAEPGALEIYADWSRQLRVLDPRGRQLVLSCGCALLNARVALAAAGFLVQVDRFPDPARPDLIARLTVDAVSESESEIALAALEPAIDVRRTNRREFSDEPVPDDVVATLRDVAAREGGLVHQIATAPERATLTRLSQEAERIEKADPAYVTELRAWTSQESSRPDGVPSSAIPRASSAAAGFPPLRDFDTTTHAGLPEHTGTGSGQQCLLLLGAAQDTRTAWLRVGEALERVLLEVARLGYAASPLTQVIEVASTHERLRRELGLTIHPHVVVRVGKAPDTPVTRRRRLVDVLTVRGTW